MSWRQAHKIIKEKNLRYSVLSKENGISSDRRSKLLNDGWVRVCKNMYMLPKYVVEEVTTKETYTYGFVNWPDTFKNCHTSGELSRLFKDQEGVILYNMRSSLFDYENSILPNQKLEKRKAFYKFKCKNPQFFL